jgi:hypothetical protein
MFKKDKKPAYRRAIEMLPKKQKSSHKKTKIAGIGVASAVVVGIVNAFTKGKERNQ